MVDHPEQDAADFIQEQAVAEDPKPRHLTMPDGGGRIPLDKMAADYLKPEKALLGGLIYEQKYIPYVLPILTPDMFSAPVHREIFAVVRALFEGGRTVDPITVGSALKDTGAATRYERVEAYVSGLIGEFRFMTEARAIHYAEIVLREYKRRRVEEIGLAIHEKARDAEEDPDGILSFAEREVYSVARGAAGKRLTAIEEDIVQSTEDLTSQEYTDGVTGVYTGFRVLDDMTGGWQPTDLIIIAARPSMGKTALSLSEAFACAAKNWKAVAYFSLEMSRRQLLQRMVGMAANLDGQRVRQRNLSPDERSRLREAASRLAPLPVYIDDTAGISISQIRAKTMQLACQVDLGLVIVDYLQLVTVDSTQERRFGNREQEIALISRSLKGMAKDLNVPVIALAQLSRAVEQRGGDKRPNLSDLRESGQIEQDADVVAFIYRAERYGITLDEDGQSTEGIAEIIFGKQRNGPVGTKKLAFLAAESRFADLAHW